MRKTASFTLISTAIAIGLGAVTPTIANAGDLRNAVNNDTRIAQASLFFPPASDRQAIMVLGQGQVSLPADTARMEFVFNPNIPSEESPSPTDTQAASFTLRSKQDAPNHETQLTKETLKPIVDALVKLGVPASNIEVIVPNNNSSSIFGGEGSAKMIVSLEKPTRDRVQQIVNLVRDTTAKNKKLLMQSVNVRYAIKDCQNLVRSAYQAAARDARNRAEAIAEAMNVQLGKSPSVADSFLYDLFVPLCSETSELPSFLPFGTSTATPYNPDAPAEVQLRRDIFVTFPIKR